MPPQQEWDILWGRTGLMGTFEACTCSLKRVDYCLRERERIWFWRFHTKHSRLKLGMKCSSSATLAQLSNGHFK